MVAVPAELPVTAPVVGNTAAMPGLLLVQVAPGVIVLSEVVLPTQTDDAPVITAGNGFTVMVTLLLQPVGTAT